MSDSTSIQQSDNAPDVARERFHTTITLILQSAEKGHGRTLDPEQVEALAQGFIMMSTNLGLAQGMIRNLEEEVAKKRRLWRPGK